MEEERLKELVAEAFGDTKLYALRSSYDAVLSELDQLAEAWLEWRAEGKDTKQLAIAIDQAIRESRKYEKKLRKLES